LTPWWLGTSLVLVGVAPNVTAAGLEVPAAFGVVILTGVFGAGIVVALARAFFLALPLSLPLLLSFAIMCLLEPGV
jgi:hypothetical protein